MTPKIQIIQHGAEAIILKKGNLIIKKRLKKSYRLPEIDEKIRKLRTRSEGKLMKKALEKIPIPAIIKIDETSKEIIMNFVNGKKISDNLDKFSLLKQLSICEEIGCSVSKLHSLDIIHGDLTTSNMILSKKKIYFIDFGLGFNSKKIEDKAVDLHLLKQALEAKHFQNWEILFEKVIKGYSISQEFKKIIERLKAVEKRGRYKDSY